MIGGDVVLMTRLRLVIGNLELDAVKVGGHWGSKFGLVGRRLLVADDFSKLCAADALSFTESFR